MRQANLLLRLCLLMLISGPVSALQPPTPGGGPGASQALAPQAGEQPAEAPQVPAEPDVDTDAGVEQPPARGDSPDTFTPSERIEADSAVSFPVDI